MAQEIDITVPVNDSRIAWVLDHPRMSDWLKAAVRTAQGRDPSDLHNDLEILSQLFRM